jgi:hypothetical protein
LEWLTHYRSQSITSEADLRFTNTTDNAKFNVNKPLVHSTAQSFLWVWFWKGTTKGKSMKHETAKVSSRCLRFDKYINKSLLRAITLAMSAGLAVGLTGCCSLIKSCLHQVLFITQPQSQTVETGMGVTFSVYALAGPPFTTNGISYQWQFNGTQLSGTNFWADLPGETNSSVTITSVTITNVGFYRVLVSGSSTLASDPAALQVIDTSGAPIITVYGTPIASGGTKGTCPGTYTGYIKYTNNPAAGLWGWRVVNTALAATGADGRPTAGSKVEYLGYYGDTGCNPTSVSTRTPPGSPRYVFTLYFTTTPVPTGSYAFSLTNLQ